MYAEYHGIKKSVEAAKKREAELRVEIADALLKQGTRKGKSWFKKAGKYKGKRTDVAPRVSLDEAAATEVLQEKKLYDQCTKVVLDPDAIDILISSGDITKSDVKKMFVEGQSSFRLDVTPCDEDDE